MRRTFPRLPSPCPVPFCAARLSGVAGFAVACAVGLAAVAECSAQGPAAVPKPSPVAAAGVQGDRLLSEQAARHVMRVAVSDLRAATPATPMDYEFAGLLLELASELDPADASIVRYRAEAAFNAGDAEAMMKATRRIVEADPSDTVALLRLITARINRIQTAEERLAAFESFLGPKGSGLDASVRSRLALDAALLCRERSDEDGFVRFVRQAAQLDSTNKDAALLVFQHFSQNRDDALGRLELLANLLYSDPIDPIVHRMIRDELIAGAAFEAARRFHTNAERIASAARSQPSMPEVVESMCVNWRSDGARATFDAINRSLLGDRDKVVSELAQMDPVLQKTARKPEDVRLTFEFEEIRLGAAIVLEDRAAIDASLTDLAATVAEDVGVLADPTKREAEISEEDARQITAVMMVGLQIWRCLVERDIDKVDADIPKIAENLGAEDPLMKTLLLWRSVRGNDAAATRALIETAPTNPWAILAVATFELEQGNMEAAASGFMRASAASPLQVPGVLGWAMAERVSPGITAPTALTRELTDYAKTIPTWIDTMVDKPRMTQTLAVSVTPADPEATEHTFATITIRNLSTIPLGVGSDRIINSRLLFAPSLERKDGSSLVAEPEFVEVSRRLRLMPGDTFTARIWPEVGLTGLLAEVACSAPTRLRWRVLQGFEAGQGRGKRAGPGSQEASTTTITRRAVRECAMLPPEFGAAVAASSDDRWPIMLYAARAGMLGPVGERRFAADNRSIMSAVATKFVSLPPALRQLTLAIIPPVSLAPEAAALDAGIVDEQDPGVLALAVATRCTKAEDPILLRAAASADVRLARLAAIQTARIAAGTPTYASTGFGGSALTPRPF